MNDYERVRKNNESCYRQLRNPESSLHQLLNLAYIRGDNGFLIKNFVGIKILLRLNLVVEKYQNFYIISNKGIEILEKIRNEIYEREFSSQERQKS